MTSLIDLLNKISHRLKYYLRHFNLAFKLMEATGSCKKNLY